VVAVGFGRADERSLNEGTWRATADEETGLVRTAQLRARDGDEVRNLALLRTRETDRMEEE
jgi:hypothetical protein